MKKIYFLALCFLSFNISFAQDVSTSAFRQQKELFPDISGPTGIAVSNDGTKMFVSGNPPSGEGIALYDLTTAYDVTTATRNTTVFLDISGGGYAASDLVFNSDGTKLFIMANFLDFVTFEEKEEVLLYNLTTGFDLSTASLVTSLEVTAQEDFTSGIALNDDGTKLYIIGKTNDAVVEYTMGTAYDLANATPTGNNLSVSGETDFPEAIRFSNDGNQLFALYSENGTGLEIYVYDLTTPYTLVGATYAGAGASPTLDFNTVWATGMAFSGEDKMYLVGPNFSGAPIAEYDLTVAVPDTESPVFTSDAAVNFAENGTGVAYTATATDASTITYSLADGGDKTSFTIDTNSGEVSFNTAPDFEDPQDGNTDNVYDITVVVSDGINANTEKAVTITVTDLNDVAPVFSGGASTSVEFVENETSVVYTATATDVDTDNTNLVYDITAGADQVQFEITNGAVTFTAAPDFENPADANQDNIYEITLSASDGTNSTEQQLTVTVTNLDDEVPVFDPASVEASFAENGTATVYTAEATDESTLAYSLAETGDYLEFSIDGSSGAISFKNAPDFEVPTDTDNDNVYQLTVVANDGINATADLALTITVTDVDESPVFTSEPTVTIVENTTSVFYTVTTEGDNDYALSLSGVDSELFTLIVETGAISFTEAPDFETPLDDGNNNVYDITITADAGVNGATDFPIAITVTDRFEYSGGTGTNENPYLITKEEELLYITNNASEWGLYFEQQNDIILTVSSFKPIAYQGQFTGIYDGGQNIISNFKQSGYASAGLFDNLAEGAEVKNLGLPDVIINVITECCNSAGGFVTTNSGTISNCFITGSIGGAEGLSGFISYNTGSIVNSYARINVSGQNESVGFCSGNEGVIENCYFSGTLSAVYQENGLTSINSGQIINSYWNSTLVSSSEGGEGKTTEEMQTQSTFEGWDFDNVWVMFDYPVLQWQAASLFEISGETAISLTENLSIVGTYSANVETSWTVTGDDASLFTINEEGLLSFIAAPDFETPSGTTENNTYTITVVGTISGGTQKSLDVTITVTNIGYEYSGGAGTEENPFLITLEEELIYISGNPSEWVYHFQQENDIKITVADFGPIGNSITGFTGSYNGNEHVISDLKITSNFRDAAFFYRIAEGATVINLGLENVDFTAEEFAAGFVTFNSGTILQCYVTGSVTGIGVGGSGFVSFNEEAGVIENSYSLTNVKGISSIYEDGFSSSSAGISNCYYVGNLGNELFGSDGTKQVKTTAEMQTQSTFVGWDFANVWQMDAYPIFQWQNASSCPSITSVEIVDLPCSTTGQLNLVIDLPTNESGEAVIDTYTLTVTPIDAEGAAGEPITTELTPDETGLITATDLAVGNYEYSVVLKSDADAGVSCPQSSAAFTIVDDQSCPTLSEASLDKLCALKEALPASTQQNLGWPSCSATSDNPADWPGISVNNSGAIVSIDLSELGLEELDIELIAAFENLETLDVSDNQLYFDDLESLIPFTTTLIASNQATVGNSAILINIQQGEEFKLAVIEGATGVNGTVEWFFVEAGATREEAIKVGTGTELFLQHSDQENDSYYFAEISHPDFDFSLATSERRLSVIVNFISSIIVEGVPLDQLDDDVKRDFLRLISVGVNTSDVDIVNPTSRFINVAEGITNLDGEPLEGARLSFKDKETGQFISTGITDETGFLDSWVEYGKAYELYIILPDQSAQFIEDITPSDNQGLQLTGTVNSDGTLDITTEVILGLSKELIEVNVYPNPVQEVLFIQVEDESNMKLFNLSGIMVHEEEIVKTSQISLDNLPNGVYLLEVFNQKGRFISKIIKQ